MGHALRYALSVIARQQEKDLGDVATEAGADDAAKKIKGRNRYIRSLAKIPKPHPNPPREFGEGVRFFLCDRSVGRDSVLGIGTLKVAP